MLEKLSLSEVEKVTIIDFLKEFLHITSCEENKLLHDRVKKFIEDYSCCDYEVIGYCYNFNFMQGVVWKSDSGEWIFAVLNERAFRDLIRVIPENEKINLIIDKKYVNIAYEYINIISDSDENITISGVKGIYKDKVYGEYPVTIEGKKNSIVSEFKECATLQGRIQHEKFVVEGERLVKRALEDGQMVEMVVLTAKGENNDEIIELCKERRIPCYLTNAGTISCMTNTHPVPGMICSIRSKIYNQKQLIISPKKNYFLILDGISNPDNLGIILRTADAAGASGLILLSNSTHYFNKNAIRGARGAVGRMPVYVSDNDDEVFSILQENEFKVIGTSARFGASNFYEIDYAYKNIAIVVGNETDGVRKEILDRCNEYAKIPMAPGQSSLNIAVSSALFMYEHTRLFQ